jgi:hypothetical protein
VLQPGNVNNPHLFYIFILSIVSGKFQGAWEATWLVDWRVAKFSEDLARAFPVHGCEFKWSDFGHDLHRHPTVALRVPREGCHGIRHKALRDAADFEYSLHPLLFLIQQLLKKQAMNTEAPFSHLPIHVSRKCSHESADA